MKFSKIMAGVFAVAIGSATVAHAEDVIGSVNTAFAIGGDHRIDIERVVDPKLPVVCYLSHPIKGGISGYFGMAKNHSLFSISCVAKKGAQVDMSNIANGETIMTQRTSWFSKQLIMNRFIDKENHNVIYMVTAQNEIIDGSPFSSISTVSFP